MASSKSKEEKLLLLQPQLTKTLLRPSLRPLHNQLRLMPTWLVFIQTAMASIAGLYGGYTANQEDGSGGRNSFFRGFRGGEKNKDSRGGARDQDVHALNDQ